MLYEKAKEAELDKELFIQPPSVYRAMPFWAWNTRLKEEQLVKQVHQFSEMGMGGFHIHCRVGLDIEYLGKEFFSCVHACVEEAKKEGLYCCLYDEDRWPSGSAGGIVTQNHAYRNRFLVFSPMDVSEAIEDAYMSAAKAVRSTERTLLARYRIQLDTDGYLEKYERMTEEVGAGGNIWEAFLEVSGDTPWFNNQAYVNTLDKAAIRRFIEVTHEAYAKELGSEFGKSIRSIFTDEPQTTHKGMWKTPFEMEQMILPFTDDLDGTFADEYGYSLLERLPEVLWEKRDGSHYSVRYQYHSHISERFASAFGDQVSAWCKEHSIGLTGHMFNEWTLYSQALALGECMRPMKNFEIPGVDMLCDRREFSTLKQAQSVARQYQREGVMSEIYGVTGWAFDFRNHKLAGDWQAALGVTLRVPHLTWVSMEGEGKRDYPASIGYQSPWYKSYHLIEDHFARLNTAMTRGRAEVKIGVIHPIESYWMYWGNQEQTALKRQVLEENFSNIIKWLLFGLLDFDFISESMLSQETQEITPEAFPMGDMRYHVVVVPECHTLQRTTVEKLELFQKKGGKLVFLGNPPDYVDAICDNAVHRLSKEAVCVPFGRTWVLEALEEEREVDVSIFPVEGQDTTKMNHTESGYRADNLFYQLRRDGKDKWLFLCHVNKASNEHIAFMERWEITVWGIYQPICYDTLSGEIYPLAASYINGKTYIEYISSIHGSLLLCLKPREAEVCEGRKLPVELPENVHVLPEPAAYVLLEENCMLLDQAEYAFNNEGWQEREELLRIDNLFREKVGYPLRMEAMAQPWVQEDGETEHMLKLQFTVKSEIALEEISLAMEHPELAEVFWNGKELMLSDIGWYVDEAIRRIALPGLLQGENLLEIHLPFGSKTNVEWMYLLGKFGVRVAGRNAVIVPLPEQLVFGDITRQDLAFYSSNLDYYTEIDTGEGELYLEVPHYRGAFLSVLLDGKEAGNIFLAPYRLNCGSVSAGRHRVAIRCYGNRMNAFGAVHNADEKESWYGPNLWRTQGNKWSYEYQLQETGILTTPVYWVKEKSR